MVLLQKDLTSHSWAPTRSTVFHRACCLVTRSAHAARLELRVRQREQQAAGDALVQAALPVLAQPGVLHPVAHLRHAPLPRRARNLA